MNSSQLELILLAQQGDKQAYCKLVRINQSRVRAFIASRSRYQPDVDDIAQEAFILAFTKINQLQNTDLFNSWLCGIALNLLRNHERKFDPCKQGCDNQLDELITAGIEELTLFDSSVDSISALKVCQAELDKKWQQVLDLYYFKNQSIQQLSKLTGDKHSTITMRLYRIRDALKKCVTQRLGANNE
ncbi:RNA polymerase sigma factor [Paraglaciecola sp. L3A3]|uniref:RNA polymerase sigma factor n=1 Tax=Paraglaciecola sp. L3A3 TaxID=2686358 RepID=UPI00131EAFC2|nr:sigma-70 family RNA polymerase sigma factor [Paraglaciecola sp. L3A3]